jgi:hypothetical protein
MTEDGAKAEYRKTERMHYHRRMAVELLCFATILGLLAWIMTTSA